jgi:hypothetical protein
MVHNKYWIDNDLQAIAEYCEKDVYSNMLIGKKILG